MKAILEAIDAEKAKAIERAAQLQELRERVVALDEGGDEAPPVRKAESAPEPKRKSKPKPKRRPSTSKEEAVAITERLLAFLREHPEGVARGEIAAGLGLSAAAAKRLLNRCVREGKIRVQGVRAGTRYFPSSAPISQDTNGNGARTNLERQVVEAVEDVGLRASEVAEAVGIPQHRAVEVLEGLSRRSVLARTASNGSTIYEVVE